MSHQPKPPLESLSEAEWSVLSANAQAVVIGLIDENRQARYGNAVDKWDTPVEAERRYPWRRRWFKIVSARSCTVFGKTARNAHSLFVRREWNLLASCFLLTSLEMVVI